MLSVDTGNVSSLFSLGIRSNLVTSNEAGNATAIIPRFNDLVGYGSRSSTSILRAFAWAQLPFRSFIRFWISRSLP